MDKKYTGVEIDTAAIGAAIQKYRRIAGLTQDELAERIGCSSSNISRIEIGMSKPSFSLAIAIANALNVGLDQLYLPVLDNPSDYYASEYVRLTSHFSPRKKERILNLIKLMLEVMEEQDL